MTVKMFAAAGLKPPGHRTLDPRLYARERSRANPTRRVPIQTQSTQPRRGPSLRTDWGQRSPLAAMARAAAQDWPQPPVRVD